MRLDYFVHVVVCAAAADAPAPIDDDFVSRNVALVYLFETNN